MVSGIGSRAATPTAMNIGYTITAPATTEVSILKGGHVIRTIESGVTREAGDASLVWDLKNNKGVIVPGDVYVLEVKALDGQGHLARQVTPLVLPR
jgi:flagellar hook assembly protein FlgD